MIAYKLASDGEAIDIKIFVNAPYDRYVTPRPASGMRAGSTSRSGAGGVDVRTESLVALIAGGVAFDTPPFVATAEPAAADTSSPSSATRRPR